MILANTGYTAEMLQAAYEGTNGHQGYNTTVASEQYYKYTTSLTRFNEAYTAWSGTIADNMSNYLTQTLKGNGKDLNTIKQNVSNANDINSLKTVLNDLSAFVTEAEKLSIGNNTSKNYFDNLKGNITLALTGERTYTAESNMVTFDGDTHNGTLSLVQMKKAIQTLIFQ